MRGRAAPAVISLGLLLGCGSDNGDVTFDSAPAVDSTTSVPAAPSSAPAETRAATPTTTMAPAPATSRRWVDAAGNLAGLDSECGNMLLVTTRPDRDVTIAGIASHGLWASVEGAAEWSPLAQGEGSDVIANRPLSILYDPDNPDTYWESGSYGASVFRTDDGGATFRQLGDAGHLHAVSADFTDPARATLLAGAHEQSRLLRSTDGGSTWTDVSGGLPEDSGFASFPLVIDAQTHMVGTRDGRDSGIFRTTDGGATWQRVSDTGVSGLPLVSRTDGAIYWIRESGDGLLTSVDVGQTWTVLPSPLIVDDAANLVELSDGSLVTLGAYYLVVSQDRGRTWQPMGPRIPYRPSGLTFSEFGNAFYVWRSDCEPDAANPIRPDSILRLDLKG